MILGCPLFGWFQALDHRIVQQGTELADFDVFGRWMNPVGKGYNSEVFFRIYPDAGSGIAEMSVRAL